MSASTRPRQGLALVLSLVVPFVIGGLGALSTDGNVEGWYAEAVKAPWTPPNWVFGPVWTVLYVFLGLSFWRAWRAVDSNARTTGIRLFIAQMVLNAIWTPIFFAGYPSWGESAFWQGAIIIVAMDIITWLTIVQFKRVDITAARLLIPYEAWLWIATSLNIYLWLNN